MKPEQKESFRVALLNAFTERAQFDRISTFYLNVRYEKRLLVVQGRVAALRFLQQQKLAEGPSDHEVIEAVRDAYEVRRTVISKRNSNRSKK